MRGRLAATAANIVTGGLARLRLRTAQRVGVVLADVAWFANLRPARITRANVDACFVDLTARERRDLARASLRETGKLVGESGLVWRAPAARWHDAIARVVGEDALADAHEAGSGVLLLVPHVGNWELLNLFLGERHRLVATYVPTRYPALDARIIEWRNRAGSTLVAASRAGIRALYRRLRDGGVVAILPDQVPPRSAGVYAPFFDRQALTLTLCASLLRATGARPLLASAMRCDDGRFEIRFEIPDVGCADRDPAVAATALNRSIERVVRRCPAQYQWEYKRFKNPPEGAERIY